MDKPVVNLMWNDHPVQFDGDLHEILCNGTGRLLGNPDHREDRFLVPLKAGGRIFPSADNPEILVRAAKVNIKEIEIGVEMDADNQDAPICIELMAHARYKGNWITYAKQLYKLITGARITKLTPEEFEAFLHKTGWGNYRGVQISSEYAGHEDKFQ